MEIDIDSMNGIFLLPPLFLTTFEIPEIKKKRGIYICGLIFFVLLMGKYCDVDI